MVLVTVRFLLIKEILANESHYKCHCIHHSVIDMVQSKSLDTWSLPTIHDAKANHFCNCQIQEKLYYIYILTQIHLYYFFTN